ncbi:YpjP family protein [Oceanobacillus halotolerans]|uniref:YpjP family protein n=1 Tax=Oceanobacillus halotolerans TaxID=2663380 RepID=UPI0013D112CB|nr:YpjP family protein [Oceanobacillus halotolerans]
MKQWMRKLFVMFVAIVTLGMYVPPITMNTNAEEEKEAASSNPNVEADAIATLVETHTTDEESAEGQDLYFITEKAKEQTFLKLGPRITSQLDNNLMSTIYENMEEAIQLLLDEEEMAYYGITEDPSNGTGEKIFHLYDTRTENNIAMFHVRRDKRPLEGYWFNFHYHTSHDGFSEHHVLGEIFWDKNTPPNWMT